MSPVWTAHALERDAELLGGDQAQRGGGPLAEVDRAGPQGDRAVAQEIQRGSPRPSPDRQGGVLARESGRRLPPPMPYQIDATPTPRRRVPGPSAGLGAPLQRLEPVRPDGLDRRAVGRVALEDLAGQEPVALPQPVPLPELERVHAEPLGELVHLRLDGERDLRRPRTAHAAGRRVVREHDPAVELDVRPAVGTGRRGERLDHEPGAERGVRAGVGEHVDLEGGEVAVARGAASAPDPVRVPLRGGLEGLGPAVDDLDRPARPIRGQRRQALARDLRLAAEGAPDDGGDDADALGRQAQRPRDLGPLVVGVLRRRPHDERVALPEGERGLRLEVGVLVPRGRVGALHDDVGAGEPFRDVARPEPVLGQQVAAGMDPRCAVRERVVGREHGGKLAVLDLDHRERRGRRLRRGRHDEGDGIAHLANPVVGEDRLVLHLAPVAVLPGDVAGGQDRLDARQQARALRVDAHDLGVGVRAPQHPGMQHPVDREVGRVDGAARRLVQRVRAHVCPAPSGGNAPPPSPRSRGPPARRALLPVGHPLDRVHDALVARCSDRGCCRASDRSRSGWVGGCARAAPRPP